jgi:uncharacterized protein involved in exopolysaccharide biosynthesis
MAERDEITLKELVLVLWKGRWIVFSVTALVAIAVTAIALMLPDEYKATVLISPVTSSSSSSRLGGSAQNSAFGGLASLIGISIGGDTNRSESLAVLQSEALTEQYIRDNELLPVLFAKRWNPAARKWLQTDPTRVPTPWQGNKLFAQKVRLVTEDKKTGLVTLTITWTDPATAARWANDLVRLTNDYLRGKAIRESEQHIVYLNGEAASTDVAQVRTAIYTVLESEIKNVMLAKGPGDYALKVIDPAIPPEKKSGPFRALWALGGMFGGLVLSFLVLFLRGAWRADRSGGAGSNEP